MLSNNQLDYIDNLIESTRNSKTILATKIKEISNNNDSDYQDIVRMFEDENINVVNDIVEEEPESISDDGFIAEPIISNEELKVLEAEMLKEFSESDESEQKYARYFNSTQALFNDVSDIPLLNSEDEVHYSRLVQEGLAAIDKLEGSNNLSTEEIYKLNEKVEIGEQAKEIMFNSNVKLVISIAKKYVNKGIELNDAIQEGCLGLLRAIIKFDYRLGFKFSTYCYYWCAQSIQRAIADKARCIRLPVHLVELINRMYAKERFLAAKLGRDATEEELAEALGITITKLHEIINYAQKTKSLDTPIGEDEEDTFSETVKDENTCSALEYTMQEDKNAKIHKAISRLTKQEQDVIKLRYGFVDRVHTLQEIADKFGLSRERIRQVQEKAEIKLKQYLNPNA